MILRNYFKTTIISQLLWIVDFITRNKNNKKDFSLYPKDSRINLQLISVQKLLKRQLRQSNPKEMLTHSI